MNACTNQVDVLAVMGRIAPWLEIEGQYHPDHGRDFREAHAAVAELIEAVAEFRRRRSASAEERMYGALARCGAGT